MVYLQQRERIEISYQARRRSHNMQSTRPVFQAERLALSDIKKQGRTKDQTSDLEEIAFPFSYQLMIKATELCQELSDHLLDPDSVFDCDMEGKWRSFFFLAEGTSLRSCVLSAKELPHEC